MFYIKNIFKLKLYMLKYEKIKNNYIISTLMDIWNIYHQLIISFSIQFFFLREKHVNFRFLEVI